MKSKAPLRTNYICQSHHGERTSRTHCDRSQSRLCILDLMLSEHEIESSQICHMSYRDISVLHANCYSRRKQTHCSKWYCLYGFTREKAATGTHPAEGTLIPTSECSVAVSLVQGCERQPGGLQEFTSSPGSVRVTQVRQQVNFSRMHSLFVLVLQH